MPSENAVHQGGISQKRIQQTVQEVILGLEQALASTSQAIESEQYAELVGKLCVHYFTEKNGKNTSILNGVISLLTNKKGKGMSGKELELKDFFDNSVGENKNKPQSPLFNVSDGGSIQIEQFVMHQYVQAGQNTKKEE
jgi:hypothetical protein